MELSVIIVNYNVKHFLEQCLISVIKASTNISAEIFVVDNKAISTLPASSMDDREFDLFKKQDSHYFKKVFEIQI